MSSGAKLPGGRPAAAVDLERQAHEALGGARREARALITETRRELESEARLRLGEAFDVGREEGRSAGYRDGCEAGRAQALEEARPQMTRALSTFKWASRLVARSREAVRAEAEAGLVRLAAAIGTKLAARELALRPDAAREDVRSAIALVSDRAEVRVLVNPAERDAVEAVRESFREQFPEIIRMAIEPDGSVPPGGAKVVTASAVVDATLEARADRIAGLLLGRADGARPGRDAAPTGTLELGSEDE